MSKKDFSNLQKTKNLEKDFFKEKGATKKQKEFEKAFAKIYKELILTGGQNFYEKLSEVLDIDQYLSWMSFNYFIGNGDYTDEFFL